MEDRATAQVASRTVQCARVGYSIVAHYAHIRADARSSQWTKAVQSAVANMGGGAFVCLFVCLTYRQKSEYDTNSIGVTTRFDSYIW